MNLAHIELTNLTVSPANMRAKRKNRDIAELIPSVAARGVLVPLLVRPNGEPDTYEIIAGRRRYFAAKAVAEKRNKMMALPCAIVEPGDDAAALEASLIENVARLDPDEVSQWETFARLVKQGRGVEDIAATFGIPERLVCRVLALGNLMPRIRGLYGAGKIDAGTVRQLTMATSAQQREWLSLYESDDGHAPAGRSLKAWLFGGAAIATSSALFDLAEYTAPIVADLFDEHCYFSDSAMFWSLQNKAIDAKRQAYIADGWAEVVVLTDGHWFDRWAYEKRSRAKGGRIYIAIGEHGAVEIHQGYIPRKEAKRRDQVQNPSPAILRPEITAPLRRYLDLHRHAAVRAKMLDQPWIALRLLLAHAIAGSALWTVRCERQRAEKEETGRSLATSPAQALFDNRRKAVLTQLGVDPEMLTLVDDGCNTSLAFMFEVLTLLNDEEVLELTPIVMGETLEAGGEAIAPLGQLLAIDMSELWQADDAFFTLIRDRKVLTSIVEEVAGPDAARANSEAPTKVLKAIVHDCLTGRSGRPHVEKWVPRWLRFPPSSYFGDESEATERVEQPDAMVSDPLTEPKGSAEEVEPVQL